SFASGSARETQAYFRPVRSLPTKLSWPPLSAASYSEPQTNRSVDDCPCHSGFAYQTAAHFWTTTMPGTQSSRPVSSDRHTTGRRLVRWEWNRRIGWASACVGAASGLILGLWSFDGPFTVPEWLGEYDQVGRRLARLGHIAFFGLGILNILMAGELRRL